MSMTRAEKKIVEELKVRIALSWTGAQEPDLPAPSAGSGGRTSGWTFNEYTFEVRQAWSQSMCHGIGAPAPESRMSGSQGGIALFSTKLLALRALRNAAELSAAKRLRVIDAAIEQAKSE